MTESKNNKEYYVESALNKLTITCYAIKNDLLKNENLSVSDIFDILKKAIRRLV